MRRARTIPDILQDKDMVKIMSNISSPKSAKKISRECGIPIASTYRKLKLLQRFGLLDVSGSISDGVRRTLYRGFDC